MSRIEDLIYLLGSAAIRTKIEDQISQAMKSFQLPNSITNKSEFISITSDLLIHLYATAIKPSISITKQQAQVEIISLLEKRYRGNETCGFDGALYDAIKDTQEGLQNCIEILVESIKFTERGKYYSYIFRTKISSCSWSTRCEMVSELIHSYPDCFDSSLWKLPAEQLVPHLEQMVMNVVLLKDTITQISRNNPIYTETHRNILPHTFQEQTNKNTPGLSWKHPNLQPVKRFNSISLCSED